MSTVFSRHLHGNGLRASLLRAVLGSGGVQLTGMALTLVVGIQLPRELGVYSYGVYGLAMSVVAILGVPSEFGLPQLVTREVARAEARSQWGLLRGALRWSWQTACWTSVVATAALIAWLWLSGRWLRSPLTNTLLVAAALVPTVALGSINAGVLRGLRHIVRAQIPEYIVRPATFAVLLLAAHFLFASLDSVVAMSLGLVAALVSLALVIVMLRRFRPPASRTAAPKYFARKWWLAALPMALTEGMRRWQGHAAVLMLGLLSTIDTVGTYRIAASVVTAVAAPTTVFNWVAMPYLARLHATGDRARLQRLLALFSLGMTVAVTALSLPFFFAGPAIVGFVFGAGFAGADTFLLVLCVGVIIQSALGVSASLLNMTGYEARVTRAAVVAAVVLGALLLSLIPIWGGAGAAWAVTGSMTVWSVLMWRDARLLLHLNTSFTYLIFARKTSQ